MRGAGAFLPCREVFPEETEGVGDMLGLVVVQHPVQSLEGMGSLGVGGHGPVERIKVASLEGDHALSIHEAQRDDGLELRKDAGIVDEFLLCQGASCKDEEGNENDECSFSHDNLYIFCKVLYTFCLVMGKKRRLMERASGKRLCPESPFHSGLAASNAPLSLLTRLHATQPFLCLIYESAKKNLTKKKTRV